MEKSGMRILVAEDDRIAALTLKRILEKQSHQITLATDGKMAQQILRDSAFDLVLSDWMMPEVDGIELIKWIRKDLSKTIKIFMMTSLEGDHAAQYAMRSGADGFLRKPIRTEELLRMISATEAEHAPAGTQAAVAPDDHQCLILSTSARELQACMKTSLDLLEDEEVRRTCSVLVLQPEFQPKDLLARYPGSAQGRLQACAAPFTLAPGTIYLLPPGQVLNFSSENLDASLLHEPRAWEKTHRSIAQRFHRQCQAVIFDGGAEPWDAFLGISYIVAAGGSILLQDTERGEIDHFYNSLVVTGISVKLLPTTVLAQTSQQIVRYWEKTQETVLPG